MGPPSDVTPSELFRKLQETPAPSEVVDFPRRDLQGASIGRVRLMVLDMDQQTDARMHAHRKLKARAVEAGDMTTPIVREVLGDMVAREVLAMSCCAVDPIPGTEDRDNGQGVVYPRIFRDAADLGKLTADELTTLFTAFEMSQH